ncbi:SseB family protein [Actinomycetes bacterium KLBMP 9797]
MTEWEPATEAEVAMRDALREGDQEQYFRILSRAELLLPVSADALAGRTPMGWGTWTTSGRTHVLAFTSSVALRACLADNAGSARRIAFHDLAAAWPHLEWWLAVNPGLPVEGYLPAWFVAQLARGDVRLPGRAASNRPREHAEAGARARATVTVPGTPLPPQAGVSMPTAAPPNVPAAAAPPPGVPAAAPYASAPAGDASYAHAQAASGAPPAGSPVHPSPTSFIGAQGSAPGPIPAQMAAGESVPGLAPPAAAPAGASTVAPTPTASGLPRRVPAPPPPPGAPPPSMAPRPPMPSPTPGPSPIPPHTGPIPPQVSAAPPQTGPMSPPVSAVPSQAGPVMAAGPAASPTVAPDPVQSSGGVLAGEIVSDWGPPVVPGRPVAPAASAPPVPAPFAPPAPPPAHVPPPAYAPEAHVPQAHLPQAPVPPPAPVRVPQTNAPPPVPAASARPSAHPASSAAAATDFVPVNEVEKNLLAAAGDGSTDSFLSTLLLATVLVPVSPVSADGTRPGEPGFAWLTETLDGEPFIVVFTSVERLRDHLGETIETIDVKFTKLIKAWPDPGWSFAINPSTPVGAKLPGAQIIALASWADEVGLSANTDDEPGPAAVVPHDSDHLTVMQKTLPPSQVAYYLERGYDRVSGFVHRAAEMAHLTSPAALYAALGTAPAGATHNEAYVLRWPAHRPTLYRIPYGGPDEPAMRAMEGWVIERPPFRGNGFAPGESGGVIAEFKVDSVRLPHGAQLWRIGADGTEKLIALLDTDAPTWRRVGEH